MFWRTAKISPKRPATRSVLLSSVLTVASVAALIVPWTVMAPAANASTCPRGSALAQHSGTVTAKDLAGFTLWTTELHVVWCYHNVVNGKVTRIVRITVDPNLTTLGSLAGWEYEGIVPGTSDGYLYNSSGAPDSGYHIYREAHWHACLTKIGCIDETYVRMNMNVFFNGTAIFYTGRDRD